YVLHSFGQRSHDAGVAAASDLGAPPTEGAPQLAREIVVGIPGRRPAATEDSDRRLHVPSTPPEAATLWAASASVAPEEPAWYHPRRETPERFARWRSIRADRPARAGSDQSHRRRSPRKRQEGHRNHRACPRPGGGFGRLPGAYADRVSARGSSLAPRVPRSEPGGHGGGGAQHHRHYRGRGLRPALGRRLQRGRDRARR